MVATTATEALIDNIVGFKRYGVYSVRRSTKKSNNYSGRVVCQLNVHSLHVGRDDGRSGIGCVFGPPYLEQQTNTTMRERVDCSLQLNREDY